MKLVTFDDGGKSATSESADTPAIADGALTARVQWPQVMPVTW